MQHESWKPRGLFHEAAERLEEVSRDRQSRIAAFLAENIIRGQKFLVPDAGKMTDGRPFEDIEFAMRMPFPHVVLLREVDAGDMGWLPQIVVGVQGSACNFEVPADSIVVADAVESNGNWLATRPLAVQFSGGAAIWSEVSPALAAEEQRLNGHLYTPEDGAFGSLNGLSELLLMLSLDNVGSRLVEGASEALNKKRSSKGKLPIYDYHVLVIDGHEVYERSAGGSDRSVRSHFRRGHIRRLADSRRVWVRAAFVRGQRDGFVDKDYLVRSH